MQIGLDNVIINPVMKFRKLSHKKRVRVVIVLMVVAAVALLYSLGIGGGTRRTATLHVARGASVSSVARDLSNAGLIESQGVFKFAVRMYGGKVQVGEYNIPQRASTWRIARMLARGQVATVSIVIPEGLTIKQIKQQLLATSTLTGPVDCGDESRDVCNLKDGDVFPDTYNVAKGTSRLAFLDLMRKKMSSVEDAWARAGRRMPDPLRSWNDVVTLASIVQKETPRASEMPIVASVYINRLNKNMRLQADPTVVYAITGGLGDMQGAPLLRGHLKTDSPYNTYTNRGLPPAPIANVGQEAIRAVLKPADTNYLFFVADGKGGHKFSNSYEEHMKNHADWRQIKKLKNKK